MVQGSGMVVPALIIMAVAAPARASKEAAASGLRSEVGLGVVEAQPVAKVVTLLRDMLRTLDAEAEEDEEVYQKMACWCEANDKEKTFAITEGRQKIQDLKDLIAELKVGGHKLNKEIQASGIDLNKFEKSLSEATVTRAKEKAAFDAEEKDLQKSIGALEAAIAKVEGHGSSALQATKGMVEGAQSLRQALTRHDHLTSSEQRLEVISFLESAARDHVLHASDGSSSPSSNRGNMLSAMKDMLASFKRNLEGARDDEAHNSNAFEELRASLKQQIVSAGEITETKIAALADGNQKLTMSEGDLRDTRRKLTADERFMVTLKKQCLAAEGEFDQRQLTRGMEIQAVNKALSVLDSDDAQRMFAKTFGSFFFQVRAERGAQRQLRFQASGLLQAAARKAHSAQLLNIANQVRSDAFAKVKKQIDAMVVNLKKEKLEEVKKKEFCTKELFENEKQRKSKESEKVGLEEQIKELKGSVVKMGKEVAALKAGMLEMNQQLKRAGQDREKANGAFKTTVADQKATQKLLKYALRILEGFYKKKAAALAQTDEADASPYQTGRGGVMGLISDILADSKDMEAQAIRDEENAQKAYEDFVKETNASILAGEKAVTDKQKAKAKLETQLSEKKTLLDAAKAELDKLGSYNLELHSSCDFVLKNFDIRQKARDEEIEALFEAKAMLSGAKLETSFLQRRI